MKTQMSLCSMTGQQNTTRHDTITRNCQQNPIIIIQPIVPIFPMTHSTPFMWPHQKSIVWHMENTFDRAFQY